MRVEHERRPKPSQLRYAVRNLAWLRSSGEWQHEHSLTHQRQSCYQVTNYPAHQQHTSGRVAIKSQM
eukprot:scaffold48911_cov84-Cyclotella_meneghiniana.AAC.1